MSKKTQFESWLRRTQEVAVNEFGYKPERADGLDIIDLGVMYDHGLTPYEAIKEFNQH